VVTEIRQKSKAQKHIRSMSHGNPNAKFSAPSNIAVVEDDNSIDIPRSCCEILAWR